VSDGAGLSSALCNTVLYNIHTVECRSYHVHQLEKKSFIWRYSLENI